MPLFREYAYFLKLLTLMSKIKVAKIIAIEFKLNNKKKLAMLKIQKLAMVQPSPYNNKWSCTPYHNLLSMLIHKID
ncbi:hypothetical protein BpHYR1_033073 [Brachionus plicatilis]|uniref:Uncharacterized protein n=1 Tax=Brachionus plicatilis TaxID=10195 RepID=A0A3M7RIJ9_BRAPC|nr:hypothetical protein BpHYR1_033073 [Brachionus plicatilis]